jgi:hypothetical protein
MSSPKIATLGALKKTDYQPQNIQEELAKNLRQRLQDGTTTCRTRHPFWSQH